MLALQFTYREEIFTMNSLEKPSLPHIMSALAHAADRLPLDPDGAALALDGLLRDLVALRYPGQPDLPAANDPFAARVRLALRSPDPGVRLAQCRALAASVAQEPGVPSHARRESDHQHPFRHCYAYDASAQDKGE
jgi:hypothetical protein